MRWMATFIVLFSITLFALGQAPPPSAVDPHENPELNGGEPSLPDSDSVAPHPDPHAVPNPVPVRAPNLAAHPPEAVAHSPKNDSEMMSKIRKALLEDKTTSPYVRDIRIISHAGDVRLEGKVPSATVRHAVQEKARGVAGSARLDNNITLRSIPHP